MGAQLWLRQGAIALIPFFFNLENIESERTRVSAHRGITQADLRSNLVETGVSQERPTGGDRLLWMEETRGVSGKSFHE